MDKADVESTIEVLGMFAVGTYEARERIRHVNVLRAVTEADPSGFDRGERVEHCAYPDG